MKAMFIQIPCRSHVLFAVGVATALVTVFNFSFWKATVGLFYPIGPSDVLFLVSFFVLLVALHACVILILPGSTAPKLVAALFFIVSAVAGNFRDTYGILIDKETIRNIVLTDLREAGDLVNVSLVLYVVILGFIPAIIIARVRLPVFDVKQQCLQRSRFALLSLGVALLIAMPFTAHYASFLREHKSIRNLLNPAQPIYAAIDYSFSSGVARLASPVIDMSGPSRRARASYGSKPLLLFLVIGETARAQNFQLGGYKRSTNPEMSQQNGVYYFQNTASCGTSTAVSLPCIFSHHGRKHFDPDEASRQTNLLDALANAGTDVEWRENNSGSYGVSNRTRTIAYSTRPRLLNSGRADASNEPMRTVDPELCSQGSCFDEVMISGLADDLKSIGRNTVLVFHQNGSHGPAYWQRYPDRFETFKPACRTKELSRCSREEIVNAYDNSIRYTDFNLAEQVRLLTAMSGLADTSLIYVSDHGESLGENGLYLHGAPYFMAPEEQTKVPLIIWLSEGYRKRFAINGKCLQLKRNAPWSHDNIYHTVLGGMGITNAVYNRSRDILAECRTIQLGG